MTDFTWLVAALIVAATLDLGLMAALRQLFTHARNGSQQEPGVHIFGRYSPVLTWLKFRKLPKPDPAQSSTPPPEPEESPQADQDAGAAPPQPLSLPPTRGELEMGTRKRWYHNHWVEWAIILLAVTLYCAGILDLGAATRLPGNETETFQMLDWTLVNSLRDYGRFPLWNPFVQTGIPYIADPMLHVYNPVVTLPELLFGVHAGFKLGIYFSFLIGALGMWKLAEVLGLGRPARVWTALMFAFAGQPAARFFQGQYLFVLGFAYIPWIIASLLQVAGALSRGVRERFSLFERAVTRPAITAAVSLALLFFSGNAYYQLYILLAIGLLMLVLLPRFTRRPPFIKVNLQLLLNYLIIAALALGIVAIQLLPSIEFWPRVVKDTNLAGNQTLSQIFLDYTSKDISRADAYSVLPAREEFYAYIGLTPFLALGLLPLALWKRQRRPQVFLILLLFLTGAWISLENMPWREFFLEADFFSRFRHLLRILIFGSFALIGLAGIGMDALWGAFSGMLHTLPKIASFSPPQRQTLRLSAFAGLGILGTFMLFGLLDVFNTNQSILHTQEIYQPANTVQRWVAQYAESETYTRHYPTNAWYEATITNRLRYLDVWYHFADIRTLEGKINERWVQAQPNYQTQSPMEPVPENGELIQVIEGTNVYRLPDSLPIAFLVERAVLDQVSDRWLEASEVTPLAPFFTSTDSVELITDVSGDQLLVLLTTHYPGWQVKVDGAIQPLLNVGGYLAVAAPRGVHKVIFSYQPHSFYIGLLITLAASALTGFMLFKELRRCWPNLCERGRSGLAAVQQVRLRLKDWWQARQPLSRTAVYQGGALHLENPLELGEQSRVHVTVEVEAGEQSTLRDVVHRWLHATGRLVPALLRAIPLPTALFALGLAVYLLTRLISLQDWPIYFFTDEAIQTVMAEDFLHNGLRNYAGEFLPTYFSKDATYNLSSISVYLQVIPYLLFGKSVFVTRAVSVLVATFGACMVGLTLRDIFKIRYWWSSVLLLSVVPAWFLHSRTAFETVEMTAFYAAFLYFYLRYRYINPRALYAALIFGAMVFYTYSPGQLVIVVSGVFLLLSDLRYHWQQRTVALRGLLLLALLVLPFLRYYIAHPEAPMQHLSTRAPFWLEDIPFTFKLQRFFSEYLAALDPRYWFLPNQRDLDRHLMQGYGHMSIWMSPLLAVGLGLSLFKLRSSAHRAVLLVLLAVPSGSALVAVGVTRLLALVIPVVLLMTLGLNLALEWLVRLAAWLVTRLRKGRALQEKGLAWSHVILALALVGVLGGINFAMLHDARLNGPLWYQDYTLAGMQYGARQLFSAVIDYYETNPDAFLIISPNWTNGANAVAEFFLPNDAPLKLGSVEGHVFQHLPLDDSMVFVVMPGELEKVLTSDKFTDVRIEKSIEYPNSEPGFYFIRLRYVAEIDTILEAEREERRALRETTLDIHGQKVLVRYPVLDMGEIELIFDGNVSTLARSLEANPFVIELVFPEARPVSGVSMVLGSAYLQVQIGLTTPTDSTPIIFKTTFHGSVQEPDVLIGFGRTITAQQMRLEILAPGIAEPTNIHIWEISIID
jgi:hypothetical protein